MTYGKRRLLLMIPGPIEFEPAVLQALGAPTTSHVSAGFIETFGRVLEQMKHVWLSPSGQPFVVAGSGTLAMDMAGANLVEPGDRALVLITGVFGERYAQLLQRYGAEVTAIRAPLGEAIEMAEVEEALSSATYKLMTLTHVDTSTGVRSDARAFGELGRRHNVLTVLDGVCSVAGEEIRQDEWGIDVVLTASQKAVGVPPGLALLVASPRALEAFSNRSAPVPNYYADWEKWLPVMAAYEKRSPSYFGTPPVNLIEALAVSLDQILDEGMNARFERHRFLSHAFQVGVDALGLDQVPMSKGSRAVTLSAVYLPESIDGSLLRSEMARQGVVIAGGLHPEIRGRTIRVGHMGAVDSTDILGTLGALEHGLIAAGGSIQPGIGVLAGQHMLQNEEPPKLTDSTPMS